MELENQFKDFFLESLGKCGRNEMQSENQTRMSVFYEKEFLKEQYSDFGVWILPCKLSPKSKSPKSRL